MLDHILNTFLHDAEETRCVIERDHMRDPNHLEMNGQARASGDLVNMILNCRTQSSMF
jgi:hypothetical protein